MVPLSSTSTGSDLSAALLFCRCVPRTSKLTPQAPVKLQIGTGGYYVGTTWLESYEGITSDSQKWTVNQAQGTDLIFQVTDAKGQVAYQQNVDVGESNDDSCLSSKGLSSSAGVSSTAAASSAWAASSSKSSVKAASAKPSSELS